MRNDREFDERTADNTTDAEQTPEFPSEPETLTDRVAASAPWWGVSVGFHVLILLIAAFLVVSVLAVDDTKPLVQGIIKPPPPPEVEPPPPPQPDDKPFLDTDQPVIEDPAEYVAKVSDHNESADELKTKTRKGDDPNLVSDKPFKGPGTFDTIGGSSGGGGFKGRKGDGGREDLIRRGRGGGTWPHVLEALKWLSRHQNPDGSWSVSGYTAQCGGKNTREPGRYAGVCSPNPGDDDHNAGVTGLSVLAFLGAGYFHSSRDTFDGINFGTVVRQGLKWIMDHQDAEGCIGGRTGHSYMYDHLICALALTEAYGLTESTIFKEAAQKAVDFTVAAQNTGKGWRYKFKAGENDSSVTGWGVMVLKSAELSNLNVPREAYAAAKSWFDEVTREDGYSSVGYFSKEQGKVRIPGKNDFYGNHEAMTAVSVMSRIFIDKKRGQQVQQAVRLLVDDLPRWEGEKGNSGDNKTDFYYWYYATLALFQFDGPDGPMWLKWNEPMKQALVKHQNMAQDDKRGSWEPVDRWGMVGGRVYATAINALTLEIYYRYPIAGFKDR